MKNIMFVGFSPQDATWIVGDKIEVRDENDVQLHIGNGSWTFVEPDSLTVYYHKDYRPYDKSRGEPIHFEDYNYDEEDFL